MDKMSDDEFQMLWSALMGIARSAQFLTIEDVQRLLHTVSMSESLGPLLYPTEYIHGGADNLNEQRIIAEGFLAFRTAIEEVKKMAEAKRER